MSSTFNCKSWSEGAAPPKYKADADIAGIGVLAAFIASNILTMSFAFASLFLSNNADFHGNRLDMWIDRKIRSAKWLGITESKRQLWRAVIEKAILSLSDQQAITGIAVLVAGFIKHASISVYHFSIVSDLAWLSSGTHMTTLIVLDKYLHDHPTLRDTRVVLISSLGVLLLVNIILKGHQRWYDSGSFPAQCLFDDMLGHVGGAPGFWMSFNVAMIITIYLVTIVSLYDKPYNSLIIRFYKKPLSKLDDCMQAQKNNRLPNTSTLLKIWSGLVSLSLVTAKWIFIVFTTMIGSNNISLLTEVFWLAYGVNQVIVDRDIPNSEMDGNENEMTFGQIVPILMLSLTALTVREVYDDQLSENTRSISTSTSDFFSMSNPSLKDLSPDTFETQPKLSGLDTDSGSEGEPPTIQRMDTEAGNRVGGNATGSQRSIMSHVLHDNWTTPLSA